MNFVTISCEVTVVMLMLSVSLTASVEHVKQQDGEMLVSEQSGIAGGDASGIAGGDVGGVTGGNLGSDASGDVGGDASSDAAGIAGSDTVGITGGDAIGIAGGDAGSITGGDDATVNASSVAGLPSLCLPECPYMQTCVLVACVQCFHGSNTVHVRDSGGVKTVADLRVNDEVLVMDHSTGVVKYERVLADVHHNPRAKATFYQIVTETGAVVTVTPDHYVYAGCDPSTRRAATLVTARNVAVGGTVLVHDVSGSDAAAATMRCQKVTQVRVFEGTGVYNPVTASGSVAVGGVLASVYADDIPPLRDARVTHGLMWPLRQVMMFAGDRPLAAYMISGTSSSGMPYWAYYLNMLRAYYNMLL